MLSVCIPTWNRGDVLRKTLPVLTACESFAAGKVQIVISDNASDDDTPLAVNELAAEFKGRIKYWRYEKGIDPHFNFQHALEMGEGEFIKLQTDYIYYEPQVMDKMVSLLEKAEPDVGICFFGKSFDGAGREVLSLDDVLSEISFGITSINTLCLRRSVYSALEEPFREWHTSFPQVDIILRLMEQGEKAWFFPETPTVRLSVLNNRNHTMIFSNYLDMLEKRVDRKQLSTSVFKREKRALLFKYLIPYHFDFFHQYNVSRKPLPFLPYCKHFKKEWYLVPALIWVGIMWFCSNIVPIHQMLGKIKRKFFIK